jgi:transposase
MNKQFTSLSDSQWQRIQELALFNFPLQRGIPRTNLRKIWNSILYLLSRGCRWIDLPNNDKHYATRPTAHRWLIRWQKEGVFDRVISGLLQDAVKEGRVDLSQVIVDGTFSLSTGWRTTGGIWAQRKRGSDSFSS